MGGGAAEGRCASLRCARCTDGADSPVVGASCVRGPCGSSPIGGCRSVRPGAAGSVLGQAGTAPSVEVSGSPARAARCSRNASLLTAGEDDAGEPGTVASGACSGVRAAPTVGATGTTGISGGEARPDGLSASVVA
jgi:hypothetical protein